MSESDQRAAGNLAARMPPRPRPVAASQLAEHSAFEPSNPFEKVAVSLRDQIMDGSFAAGLPLPPIKEIAADHDVSVGTAHRAVALLADWGLVTARAGRRALVQAVATPDQPQEPTSSEPTTEDEARVEPSKAVALDLEVRRFDQTVSKLRTVADPDDSATLRTLLVAAIKRAGNSAGEIGDFELVARRAGEADALVTFVSAE